MKKLILSLVLLPAFYTPLSSAMDLDDRAAAAAAVPPAARPGLSPDHPLLKGKHPAIVEFMTQFCRVDEPYCDISCILSGLQKCGEAPQDRVDRIKLVLPTFLNPNDTTSTGYIYVIANLAGLPYERFDHIVAAAKRFLRENMGNDAWIILEGFQKCDEAPDFRGDRMMPVLPALLNPNDTTCAEDVIGALAGLPSERFNGIVAGVKTLLRANMDNHMDNHDVSEILNGFPRCDEAPQDRADRIKLVLPTLLNPNDTTHTGNVMLVLLDLPTARFDDIVAAAKTLLRENMSHYEVGGILRRVSGLQKARMPAIVEAAASFVTEDMGSEDIFLMLKGFEKCDEAPQDRADRITRVLPTLLNPNDPTHAGNVINELADLPSEGFDGIVAAAKTLLSPNIDNKSAIPILAALKKLPGELMPAIVEAAASFVTEDMNYIKVCRILYGFQECDEAPDFRADRITRVLPTLLNPNGITHNENLITALIRIPTERFDDIVAAAKTLLRGNMSHYDVGGILRTVEQLPEDRMQSIVNGAQMLIRPDMSGYDRSAILNILDRLNLPNQATVARAQRIIARLHDITQARGTPLTNDQAWDAIVTLIPDPEAPLYF